jgi:hypothetical protein
MIARRVIAGARLSMIILHDDADREYAYGAAQGLANRKAAPSPRGSTTRRRRMAGSSLQIQNSVSNP